MKKFPLNFLDAALWLQLLTGLAALFFLAYIGFYSRYWADDFCYLVIVQNSDSIYQAMRVIYTTWSNRYANVLLVGMVDFFGQQAIRYLPGMMIASLVLSFYLAIRQAGLFFQRSLRPLLALNLALLLSFFTILQTPNRFQSVFWMMGLVTYFAPVIFLSLMTALILWGIRTSPSPGKGWAKLALLAGLAFVSGGMSETTLAFQVTFFALFFLVMLFLSRPPQRQIGLIFSGVALAVSLLALLAVFLAPGNMVRLENIPESQFSISKIPLIFAFSFDFIWHSIRSFPVPATISILSGLGLALVILKDSQAKPLSSYAWLVLIAIPGAAYILIASMVTPSVYVYGDYGYPEPRALFPAQFVLTTALTSFGFFLGWLAGIPLSRRNVAGLSSGMIVATILLFIAAAYPLWFLQKEIQTLPQAQRYAQHWDERDTYLVEQRQQGNLDVVLHGIRSPGGLIDLRQDQNFWVNRCVADFYDLNSIAVFR